MNEKALAVESRDATKKNSCRRLRVEGYIPAIIYSHGKSELIKIQEKELFNLFKGHISESVIFDLSVNGVNSDASAAFVKDFQKDPITGKVIHLDLFRITKGEKIKTHVPVDLIGSPAGLKVGGILKHGERELLIHCLPKYLPEKITVDISALMPGESIHVGQIIPGEGIEILTNPQNVIAAVEKPRLASDETHSPEEVLPTEEEKDAVKSKE